MLQASGRGLDCDSINRNKFNLGEFVSGGRGVNVTSATLATSIQAWKLYRAKCLPAICCSTGNTFSWPTGGDMCATYALRSSSEFLVSGLKLNKQVSGDFGHRATQYDIAAAKAAGFAPKPGLARMRDDFGSTV